MRLHIVPGILARAVLLVLAVLLPSAWPSGLARPDLVILVVAVAALMHGPTTGLLTGLAGGWLVDLVPPGAEPLGASALVYAALGLALGGARAWSALSPLMPWLLTVGAAALVLVARAVTTAARGGHILAGAWALSWLMTALVAIILVPMLLSLASWLRARRWA